MATGLGLLGVHLLTLALLHPSTAALPDAANEAIRAVHPQVVRSQIWLATAVALVGAVAGALGTFALASWRIAAVPSWSALLGLSGIGVVALRTLARQPALFEDLLWRRGGLPASFQVWVVERIGVVAIDRALGVALAAGVAVALWRQRHHLRLRHALALGVMAIFAAALAHRRGHAVPGTPIIIVAADSLRPDHFSSEGYARETTPYLDRLRAQSVWADDEFVPIASTTASWASLLTGLYPHHTGVRDLFPRAEASRLFVPTLPKLLREQGYRSVAVSDYAGESFSRLDLGLDRVDAPPATSIEVFAERELFQREPLALALFTGSVGRRLFPVSQYLPVNADPDALSDQAEAAIDDLEARGKPYLLIVFYSVTHAPFAAPMPDAERFSTSGYVGPSRYSYSLQQLSDLAHVGERPSEPECEHVRSLYDGAVASFDRQVERLVTRLDRDGQQNRILVVTGDHGENLFEPGTTTEHGKWFRGGEEANRTALLLQAPHVPPSRLTAAVSGVDLTPTLLDLLHLPLPPGLDGMPLLRAPLPPDRTVFAETGLWLDGPSGAPPEAMGYPPLTELLEVEPGTGALVLRRRYVDQTITAKLRAARQGDWELVYTPTEAGARYQLFDLAHDRYGQHDLSAEDGPMLESLRGKLLDWLEEDPERWMDPGDRLVRRVEQ